jgi:K+-sensing histidine kinase KdpD
LLSGYVLAVAATVVMLLTRLALGSVLGQDAPLLLFAVSVAVAAAWGGIGPGLLATVLALGLADYFLLPPLNSFGIVRTSDQVRSAMFCLEGAFITLLIESRHRVAAREAEGLRELARSQARVAEVERYQRTFLRDVLSSVTGGRLHLCETAADLPEPLPDCSDDPLHLTAQSLRSVRHRVIEVAQATGLESDRGHDLLTAVGEAIQNALRHAGGGTARVCADRNASVVQVWVQDAGTGIEMSRLPQATLERGYSGGGGGFGHGFWLMLQTADRVWLLTGLEGTTLVLEQGREAPQPEWLSQA